MDGKKAIPEDVLQMRFDFFEKKRLDLIALIKRSRQKLIDEMAKSTTFLSQ
jgi:hypothetical protein